jgi:hypothetical protein
MNTISLRTRLALLESDRAEADLAVGALLNAAQRWTAARRTLGRPGSPIDSAWADAADRARQLYLDVDFGRARGLAL